ncbi:uncharacterized protein PGTG_09323 [Puccinia graminis f. sp. tritici CRL 75-36-700-3]|uniref:Uncharacterized protein n=1 Tax=Puccinia graminis f. sp. tritici (strain CRL 75-36-700-3 / race SCCL) TaxID=418459 RepID=E3KH35_PUCGT|nr:uncharacterized protein PGTG_09323 [Puccinia graminis f. sp. tritici CRL 75-36-700-3]EFP83610.1 hypothetical protein PGTG_09323 [Puccinia graminis f. sp. tritici CRL 75-36-700-3]
MKDVGNVQTEPLSIQLDRIQDDENKWDWAPNHDPQGDRIVRIVGWIVLSGKMYSALFGESGSVHSVNRIELDFRCEMGVGCSFLTLPSSGTLACGDERASPAGSGSPAARATCSLQ